MAGTGKYAKPALLIDDQVDKLIAKGMLISDRDLAGNYLAVIGYYRFSGYTHPFRSDASRSKFKPGTTFEQVQRIYEFDRQLRLLLTDAIERCEVAIRARIVNETAIRLGPHWFMHLRHFRASYQLTDLQRKIEEAVGIRFNPATNRKEFPTKHSETFIEHYYTNYGDPNLPPIWMTAETLSFGAMSRILSFLADENVVKAIASPFGFHHKVFNQWVFSLSYLRNLCAHHNRLWNRVFSIPPKVAKKHRGLVTRPDRFHAFAVVIAELLHAIGNDADWVKRFDELWKRYPEIDPVAMGFPSDWRSTDFWKRYFPA